MRRLAGQRRRHVAQHRAIGSNIAAHQLLRPDQRAIITRVDRGRLRLEQLRIDIALLLAERCVALSVERDLGPPVLRDLQARHVGELIGVAAVGRGAGVGAHGGRAEPLAQDDVHHPLVGGIAIFERDFLRQYLGPLDRLGRQIAHLAEPRNALATQQQHRRLPAAPARAAGLRRDRVEQFLDASCPGRPHVTRGQDILGRNVADHRPARPLPGDDDILAALFLLTGGCGGNGRGS